MAQSHNNKGILHQPLYALRFVAIFIIVIRHAQFLSHSKLSGVQEIYNTFFKTGMLYIVIMFVLSGFTLEYFYGRKEHIDLKRFYHNRFIKLYLFNCAAVISYAIFRKHTTAQFVSSFFLLQSYIPINKLSFPNLAWFVSSLTAWYILFPFITRLRTKALIIMYMLYALFSVLCLWMFYHYPEHRFFIRWLYVVNPFSVLFICAIGLVCARLYRYIEGRRTAIHYSLASIFDLVAICSVVLVSVYINTGLHYNPILRYIVSYAPAFLIVMAFSMNRGFIYFLFDRRIFVLLGKASFAIYLWQSLFLHEFRKYFIRNLKNLSELTGVHISLYLNDVSLLVFLCTLIILSGITINYILEKFGTLVIRK